MKRNPTPPPRLNFDRRLKLEFHGTSITSDAGLLAYRDLDEVLGLMESAGQHLADTRTGKNGRHDLILSQTKQVPNPFIAYVPLATSSTKSLFFSFMHQISFNKTGADVRVATPNFSSECGKSRANHLPSVTIREALSPRTWRMGDFQEEEQAKRLYGLGELEQEALDVLRLFLPIFDSSRGL